MDKKKRIFCSFPEGEYYCTMIESAFDGCLVKISFMEDPKFGEQYFYKKDLDKTYSNYLKHKKGKKIITPCRNCPIRFKCYTGNITRTYNL